MTLSLKKSDVAAICWSTWDFCSASNLSNWFDMSTFLFSAGRFGYCWFIWDDTWDLILLITELDAQSSVIGRYAGWTLK